jgi:hypothetical protein
MSGLRVVLLFSYGFWLVWKNVMSENAAMPGGRKTGRRVGWAPYHSRLVLSGGKNRGFLFCLPPKDWLS